MFRNFLSMANIFSLLRFAVIFLIVILLTYFAWSTNRPHVRYSGYLCQYRAMYQYEGHVDIAIFGSSRMQEAANAEFINRALSKAKGVEQSIVYDLSRSGRGHSHVTQFASDFVKNRPVKHLLIELKDEDLAQVHPRYAETVPWGRLLSDVRFKFNYEGAAGRWGKFNFIFSKSRDRLIKRFSDYREKGAAYFKAPKPAKNRNVTDCSPRLGTFPDPKGLKEWNKKYETWETDAPYQWDLNDKRQVRANHYTQKIIELSQSRGVDVTFVYVPRSNEPILSPDFKRDFEAKFGSRLLSIDVEASRKLYKDGFANRSHMGVAGQRVFANWLVKELYEN